MSDVILPPWIIPEEETHEWIDEGSSVFRSAFAPGLAQRQSYGGLRLKLSRRHTVRGEEKAQLLSALQATRGSYNALRTKVHFALRGSISATELLSNNTFANGTTGWTSASEYSLSVSDRIVRSARVTNAAATFLANQSAVSVTQYAPHTLRSYVIPGRGSVYSTSTMSMRLGTTVGGAEHNGEGSGRSFSGLQELTRVTLSTTAIGSLSDANATGALNGDSLYVPYISLARTPLVDSGINSLLRSDELENASWSRVGLSTVTAGSGAPDGAAGAEALVENSSTSQHGITQTVTVASSAADFAFAVAIRGNGRNFAYLQLVEGTGSTDTYQVFDIANGTLGSAATTGANWSNRRAYISSLGGGWYYCCIVARKTNAATSITASIQIASTDSGATYLGNGSSGIYAWRATLAQSSTPVRLVQTTSTASSGSSQTGTGLYIKGLTSSGTGLLLPGDWFEINGELKQCIASFNSDAAGLGYLQFEPALIRAAADNTPIITVDPMGRFLVSNIKIENEFGTQARVSYDLEHIYE